MDANTINSNIHELFGLKLKTNEIIRYKNTNIFVKTLTNDKDINSILMVKNQYDLIVIDTSSFSDNREIYKISDKRIYVVEANLLGISKAKKIMGDFCDEKLNNFILLNKINKNCLDKNILKLLFFNFSYLESYKYNINLDKYINKNNIYNIKNSTAEKKILETIVFKLFRFKKKKYGKFLKFKFKKIFDIKRRKMFYGIRSSVR